MSFAEIKSTLVKITPGIFSEESVQAMLAGRKDQTRRVAFKRRLGLPWNLADTDPHIFSGRRDDPTSWGYPFADDGAPMSLTQWTGFLCPFGGAGDLIWVKEGWGYNPDFPGQLHAACYRADPEYKYDPIKWRSPLHMPRKASRLTLLITDVLPQRLQQINGFDAKREGIAIQPHLPADGTDLDFARREYCKLWDKLNSKRGYSWESDPWVFRITFQVIKANVDHVVGALRRAA
jgi:hypothetical protein